MNKHLIFLTEQKFAGPWFSFILKGKNIGMIPVVLQNVEPTPIYKMVNTKTGTTIDRITLDFDIKEYLSTLMEEGTLPQYDFQKEHSSIRLYIDIFNKPKVPFINTFFTN